MAGLALADGGVESANVVGYQNIEVKAGFNMIALNFQPIGDATGFAITGLVQNVDALVRGHAVRGLGGDQVPSHYGEDDHQDGFPAVIIKMVSDFFLCQRGCYDHAHSSFHIGSSIIP